MGPCFLAAARPIDCPETGACHEGNHAIRGYISSSRAKRRGLADGTLQPDASDDRSRFVEIFDRDPGVAAAAAAAAAASANCLDLRVIPLAAEQQRSPRSVLSAVGHTSCGLNKAVCRAA